MCVFLSKCLFLKDNLGQKLRFLSKRIAEAQSLINRNSYWRSSIKNTALKDFPKFTGKHLWWSLFLNKVSSFRPAFLSKKCPQQGCFLVNFAKFLRKSILQDIFWQLLLNQGEKFKLFFFTMQELFDPFHATDLFWYPLKASENLRFSDVFKGYQKRSVVWNGLMAILCFGASQCFSQNVELWVVISWPEDSWHFCR